VKVALAQTNPTIGDVDGNTAAILGRIAQARAAGAELVIFPEQSILGYPAKDLLLRRELIERNLASLERISAAARDIAVIVGVAEPNPQPVGRPLLNTAALVEDGRVVARWHKRLLPTYDVFDEDRYFQTAGPQPVVELRGRRLGVTICEDMLSDRMFGRMLYACDPPKELAAHGAQLLINISASPFVTGKHFWRVEHLGGHARRLRRPLLYVNQVGGNDELLFDGASCAFDASGGLVAQARCFDEDLLLVDLNHLEEARREPIPMPPADVHAALIMGLRDYVRKCGFRHVVIGLSGGVDSSLVAALAVEALGPANVHGFGMPSRYSSEHSLADAKQLAQNLGIRFSIIPIEPVHAAFERVLKPHFEGRPPDVTEENVQARIRGTILMALSNKFGSLLLSTGNKSELATGYCTLYGDMCGGLAVISDVPKMMVYELCRCINQKAGREIIPQRVFTKLPSAELRPDQHDQQTLPPYDQLDGILERYEERLETGEQIAAAGFDPATVTDVIRRIQTSEYKRQQAAPGLKVTSKAFGFGRRFPIACRPPP